MKRYDFWIIVLIFSILAACYDAGHTDIPDKGINMPKTGIIEPVALVSSTVSKISISDYTNTTQPAVTTSSNEAAASGKSACELENESLKSETDLWRDRYTNFQCNCEASSYDSDDYP